MPRLFCFSLCCLLITVSRSLAGYSNPRLGIVGIPLGAERAAKDGLDLARARGTNYGLIEIPLSTNQLAEP